MTFKEKMEFYLGLYCGWQRCCNKILDGELDPKQVLNYIQRILDFPDFCSVIDPLPQIGSANVLPPDGWNKDWAEFYNELFDLDIDFSNFKLPEMLAGFDWVIIVAQGMSARLVCKIYQEFFKLNSGYFDNFLEKLTEDHCASQGSYALRLENYSRKMNNPGKKFSEFTKGLRSMTFIEKSLFELWFCRRTGGAFPPGVSSRRVLR